jgi:XTP/dITP diphosphohydrolase
MRLERLVLATANPGKVRELGPLISEWGAPIEVLSLADVAAVTMPEETGETYLANALLKARAVATATALSALADDSGIEVDALERGPGVRSARYGSSEAAANEKLLDALRDVPPAERTARYRAVVVLVSPDGSEVHAEGVCEGRIASAPRGTAGFGYDPIFVADELGRTVGESTAEEKARISHRARAMRALGCALQARGIIASPSGAC